MPKVIYLTGAPAAGKSSTTRLLAERIPNLLVWEYGARLTSYLKSRSLVRSQDEVRAHSAAVVTPADIVEVDKLLLEFIEEHRHENPIIIDSHPVTKESYGFRITAFSVEQIVRLNPRQ